MPQAVRPSPANENSTAIAARPRAIGTAWAARSAGTNSGRAATKNSVAFGLVRLVSSPSAKGLPPRGAAERSPAGSGTAAPGDRQADQERAPAEDDQHQGARQLDRLEGRVTAQQQFGQAEGDRGRVHEQPGRAA